MLRGGHPFAMQINIPDIPSLKNHALLSWVGLLGIIFYGLSPILFPDVPQLRQPELLPVYTLMLGLGQLLKGNAKATLEKAMKDTEEVEDEKTKK